MQFLNFRVYRILNVNAKVEMHNTKHKHNVSSENEFKFQPSILGYDVYS